VLGRHYFHRKHSISGSLAVIIPVCAHIFQGR